MGFHNVILNKIKSLKKNKVKDVEKLKESLNFLLVEICKINEYIRYEKIKDLNIENMKKETYDSFNYQWENFNEGNFLKTDLGFMNNIDKNICEITGLSRDWFKDKKILDLGCGSGRYSYGFLKLGSILTIADQSESGLNQVKELCKDISKDKLAILQKDILKWSEISDFDLVFCFGVVHHTGDTYRAIYNTANKVKSKGKLFLMIYGFPQTYEDFVELNSYELLRNDLRNFTFNEKKSYLINKYGNDRAHGWFDAVSPQINDILTFEEIAGFLNKLGFTNIKKTIKSRNHHILADKL